MFFDLSHLVYFSLYMLTLFIAYRNGKSISVGGEDNIKIKEFFPTIAAYTLFAGLRWGRGVDYNVYYGVFQEIAKGINDGWEPLFYVICRAISIIGLPWQAMVMLMSCLLICSLCNFFSILKNQLYVILPFVVVNLNDAENVMRWFMAFSFFLFAIAFFFKKEKYYLRKSMLLLVACLLTHYGFIIPVIIFILLYILNEFIDIKPNVAMLLYVAVTFMFETDMMMYFDSYIQQINVGTRFAQYQNNSEAWLTGSGSHDVFNESSGFSFFKFLPDVAIIYLGSIWRDSCSNKKGKLIYTLALFNIIFSPIASQIELLYRVNSVFSIFKVVIIALFFDMYKKGYVRNSLLNILLLIVFLLKVYTITTYPLTCKKIDTYFVWDSNGRPTLDRGL